MKQGNSWLDHVHILGQWGHELQDLEFHPAGSRDVAMHWLRKRVPKLMSTELVMPSNHLILSLPLFLSPSIFPSIRVFSNESALCIRWPKYWSFSFNISPSNEHPGLISFRRDWLDLPAVQGTLKRLLQHSSKASILWCSAFFTVQLTSIHDYWKKPSQAAIPRPVPCRVGASL